MTNQRTVLYLPGSGTGLDAMNAAVAAGTITHVLVCLFHLGYDDEHQKTGPYVHLNNDTPDNKMFGPLWQAVAAWQQAGVKVMGSLGGGGVGDYTNLFSAYPTFYPLLLGTLQTYNLDGLDLDIEESTDVVTTANVQALIADLRQTLGGRSGGFLITGAPVASALTGGGSVSANVDWLSLLPLVDFYNLQFYGWGNLAGKGSPWSPNYDTVITAVGADNTSKMVAGTLTNPSTGNGWLPVVDVVSIVGELVTTYPDFGGVMGWNYPNAENASGDVDPAGWCAAITGAQRPPPRP